MRKGIPFATKKDLLYRQQYRCDECGENLDDSFEVDHIQPLFAGGHPTKMSNLHCLCPSCHSIKTKLERKMFVRKGSQTTCQQCGVVFSKWWKHACPNWTRVRVPRVKTLSACWRH